MRIRPRRRPSGSTPSPPATRTSRAWCAVMRCRRRWRWQSGSTAQQGGQASRCIHDETMQAVGWEEITAAMAPARPGSLLEIAGNPRPQAGTTGSAKLQHTLEERIEGDDLDHITAAATTAAGVINRLPHLLLSLLLPLLSPLLLPALPLLLLLPRCHQPLLHGSQVAPSLCSSSGSSRRLLGMLPLLLCHAVQCASGCLAAAQVVPLQAVHSMNGHVGACRRRFRRVNVSHRKDLQCKESRKSGCGCSAAGATFRHASPHPPTNAVAQQDQRGAPGG
jgi:hypothetical protein